MTATDQSLSGKRALVTGASRGIGRSIALALVEAGARVVITSRTTEALEGVAGEIEQLGGTYIAAACDVTERAQVRRLRGAVLEEWGGIDVLVNNAGAAGSHKFIGHPDELWHHIIDVNLNGVYNITKAFVGGMQARKWGRIVNVASTAAKEGGKYIAAYAAAKHGVLGLTRSLAIELGPNVKVNAICPGYVDTSMTHRTIDNITKHTGMSVEQARNALANLNPQGRLLTPDEVAAFAITILQDGEITGQALDLEGKEWG